MWQFSVKEFKMEKKQSKLKSKSNSKIKLQPTTIESPTLFERLRKIKIRGPKDLSIRSI